MYCSQFLRPINFWKWQQFPRLEWRGRCVVIKSVSTQRLRPSIFRFPISSIHKSFCLSEIFLACYLIILLFRISAKCSPTWYYQKLNLVQVWSSESSNNPDHYKCLLLQHHQHICWWWLHDICIFLSHITKKWVSRSCALLDQGDPRWLAHQTWARYFHIGFEWPQIMR